MVATSSGAAVIDGQIWIACTKAASLGCNWLVPEEQELDGERGRCLADSLIRREPDTNDTVAVEKLVSTGIALRRLVCQLIDIGLPVDPFWRKDGGLAFDLLSSYSGGGRVVIGHAGGVITIDLVESLDAYRESLRVHLGEPYRTMLGHFRHEVGHYYQNILVETDPGAARYLDECREIFGDERADYQGEIARHYKFGAPENWGDFYISEYATMHPWEDFAECFAHYLHITGTLATVADSGLWVSADRVHFDLDADIDPKVHYDEGDFAQLVHDWEVLSGVLNRVNHAMGKEALYPFRLTLPVVAKLGFVNHVLITAAHDNKASVSDAG